MAAEKTSCAQDQVAVITNRDRIAEDSSHASSHHR